MLIRLTLVLNSNTIY